MDVVFATMSTQVQNSFANFWKASCSTGALQHLHKEETLAKGTNKQNS